MASVCQQSVRIFARIMEMKHARTFFILRTYKSSAVKNTYRGKQGLRGKPAAGRT